MMAVFGGWTAGYIMAVASTVALVFLAVRLSRAGALLDRWVAREVPRPLLAVPIFLGTSVVWTMIGLAFGSFYELAGLAGGPAALGSPSWPFTVMIVTLAVLPLPPLLVLARPYWWLWGTMSAVFAGAFGWLMPLLASQ